MEVKAGVDTWVPSDSISDMDVVGLDKVSAVEIKELEVPRRRAIRAMNPNPKDVDRIEACAQ